MWLTMKSELIENYFLTIKQQREEIFRRLEDLTPEHLWQRPSAGRWSCGEWLEHLYRILRVQRLGIRIYIPLAFPFAYLFRDRPYATQAPDLYTEKPESMPGPAFPGLNPKHRSNNPIPLEQLKNKLFRETAALKKSLDMEEAIAGQIRFWDGPYGWINLIQTVQIIGFHEANDFKKVTGIIEEIGHN